MGFLVRSPPVFPVNTGARSRGGGRLDGGAASETACGVPGAGQLRAMAFNLRETASNLRAMASNLRATASNLNGCLLLVVVRFLPLPRASVSLLQIHLQSIEATQTAP